ncbi:hypothetical protein [Nocardia lijiangensis]
MTELRDARLDALDLIPSWLREPVRVLFESLNRHGPSTGDRRR